MKLSTKKRQTTRYIYASVVVGIISKKHDRSDESPNKISKECRRVPKNKKQCEGKTQHAQ